MPSSASTSPVRVVTALVWTKSTRCCWSAGRNSVIATGLDDKRVRRGRDDLAALASPNVRPLRREPAPSQSPLLDSRPAADTGREPLRERDIVELDPPPINLDGGSAGAGDFVSPFDDEEIIAGNGGDLAEEIYAQAPDLKRVVCPVGGGGLIGGIARTLQPRGVSVIGVEPEVNCAMYESLQRGVALTEYDGGDTLAEGCEGAVCERTFELVRDYTSFFSLVGNTPEYDFQKVDYSEASLGRNVYVRYGRPDASDLHKSGVAKELVFTDKASGAKHQRPGLDACLKELRDGDVLLVWRLDRLGRSVRHLVRIEELA